MSRGRNPGLVAMSMARCRSQARVKRRWALGQGFARTLSQLKGVLSAKSIGNPLASTSAAAARASCRAGGAASGDATRLATGFSRAG